MRQANTAQAFSTVRFRATTRRGPLPPGGLPPSVPPAADFGILLHGCPVQPGPVRTAVAGDTVTLTFPAPVVANGYRWATAGPDPAADPVAWAVEALREGRPPATPAASTASGDGGRRTAAATAAQAMLAATAPPADGGRDGRRMAAAASGEWEEVGASAWRLDVHGRLHLYSDRSYPTPITPRGARLQVYFPEAPCALHPAQGFL
jgi:hypothetical protein